MSATYPHSILVANALLIYLSHSLQAALAFKAKLNIPNCEFAGPSQIYSQATSCKRLDELVRYLQESVSKSITLHALASRLAVIDRLRNSMTWSVLGGTPIHHGHEMCKRSADFLRFSIIAEEQNDIELSKEWAVASKMCDVAARTPKRSGADDLPVHSPQTADQGRIDQMAFISDFILQLLDVNPSILPRGSQAVADHYETRHEQLQTLMDGADQLAYQRTKLKLTDVRIQCLYTLQCDLIAYSLAQMSVSRAPLEDLLQQQAVRESLLTLISELSEHVSGVLSALDACEKVLSGAAKGACGEMRAQFAVLCDERANVLRDVCVACDATEPLLATPSDPDVLVRPQDTVRELQTRTVSFRVECEQAVQQSMYLTLYTAEAARSAKIRPYTQYHQRVTECWERAATAVAAKAGLDSGFRNSHLHFALLAEGIFASAVTCHTQWERAVERRDDKLADFWQRARERAWEVGCKSLEALKSLQAGSTNKASESEVARIADAVRYACYAQVLLAGPEAKVLPAAEADLHLLQADMLVAYTAGTEYTPNHRRTIARTVDLALDVIRVYCPVTTLELPGILLPVAIATEKVRTTLRWCARTLTTLHHLSRANISASVEAWQGALSHITAILYQLLKPDSSESYDNEVWTQRMFVTDLFVKLLESSDVAGVAGSMWLEWLASAYASALPDGRFLKELTKGVRARVVQFRLQLARALEAEVTAAADGKVAEWLQLQWPQKKRGFAVATVRGAKAQDPDFVVAEVIAAYQCVVRWKQLAAEAEADTPRQKHLKDGSVLWAALADHRMMWAEHCEHGKLEPQTGSSFGKKALAARGEGLEMAVKLMDAGLRALQAGDTKAHTKCMQVCKDLTSLTSPADLSGGGKHWSQYRAEDKARAVGQILQYAEHTLRAITAGLEGKASLAVAWNLAASVRDQALTRYEGNVLSYSLQYGATDILKRADELAEKARAREQAV